MNPPRLSTLFYFGFLGMELSYLYILVSLLNTPAYILILVLLLYPLSFFSGSALPQAGPSKQQRFTLELALSILVILLVAGERLVSSLAVGQADIMGIILRIVFCGLAWFMGYTAHRERTDYSAIALRFQIGILVILVFSQVSGSVPPVLIFFIMAPLALFLARWLTSFSRGATAVCPPNQRHFLLAGTGITIPGIILVLLFSPNAAGFIINWLRNIFTALTSWLQVQQAATPSSSEFNFEFSCNMRPEGEAPPPPVAPPPSDGAIIISPAVIWLIVFAIFLAIVTLIAFTLRRRKARRKDRPEEPVRFQIRMVSSNMLRSLILFFPNLFKKLWLQLMSVIQEWRKRRKPSEEALISIRALYRNLLRWAAKQGVARLPAHTPLEYLFILEQRFPQQQDDLRQITAVYLAARYSRRAASHEEFDRVKKAWHRTVNYRPSRINT